MLCRLQQPVRERSAGAFPEKWLVIEPKYCLRIQPSLVAPRRLERMSFAKCLSQRGVSGDACILTG